LVAYKVEGNAAKTDAEVKKIEALENKVEPLEKQFGLIKENNTNVFSKVSEVETRIQNVETSQETLKTKITALEEQAQKFSMVPDMKSEPVIPIRRDKALAALTETEVAVLEMLSTEGSKTAPEIKEKVRLSREHTARLMKKLYEEGYLERETGKIPFRYSVKKEMEKLLKKAESQQA
jgi:DNA-binding MarR family transcriptional regulator